ncbi:hypothetical protein [Leeia oryzae]|uniref:hypothetical protein n=1 Tax=Leeia oryzae TaxID=356662 RepID=UPI000376DCB2|nr:hypothetical protein [Leeia oryzae]
MAKKSPIPLTLFFPIKFPGGNVVKRFAKPCVRCGEWVELKHMEGIVKLRADRALLSANATCASCGTRFPVDCMITPDKQVIKLHIPHAFLMWYLLRTSHIPATSAASTPDAAPAPSLRPVAAREVEMAIDVVGNYQGQSIPAAVSYKGIWYDFERVAMKQEAALAADELWLDSGLIFRRRA